MTQGVDITAIQGCAREKERERMRERERERKKRERDYKDICVG